MPNKVKITAKDKEMVMSYATAIRDILDTYPQFEDNTRYILTQVARSRNTADTLLRHLSALPTKEE